MLKNESPAANRANKYLHHKFYQKPRYKQGNFKVIRKDFARLNQAALNHLPRLLAALGVAFREEHHEVVMLNPRRADTHYGSFRISGKTGRWADFALHDVHGGDAVSLCAYLLNVRQRAAAQWVQRVLGGGI